MHKYWARKPANVVRDLIALHSEPGDLVLDPFCGSGVVVVEALGLGRRALGLDVNPMAVRLAALGAGPPSAGSLDGAMRRLRETVGGELREESALECPGCGARARLRYRILASVARCRGCARESLLGDAAGKRRRSQVCEGCGEPLVAADTVADRVRGLVVDCPGCRPGARIFPADGLEPLASPSGSPFLENPRILAHAGLRLSWLYTARSWERLQRLRRAVETLPDDVRAAADVAFTSTAVQGSRLIPYRQNLSTGGPAWTVPGFWVPSVHLEVDVWRTFEARFRRVVAGLADARQVLPSDLRPGETVSSVARGRGDWAVANADARRLRAAGVAPGSVDLILTDPPYGDSVPYLEFSQLWNGWLGMTPDFEAEIGISNAPGRGKDMAAYGRDLGLAFDEMARVLRPGGCAVVFFQNRDLSAWRCLGDAAAAAGFVLEAVEHHEPAVVSAKAQLARSGSLTAEVILRFRRRPRRRRSRATATSWRRVAETAAREAVAASGGEAGLEELVRAVLTALWSTGTTGGDGDLGRFLAGILTPLPGGRFRLS